MMYVDPSAVQQGDTVLADDGRGFVVESVTRTGDGWVFRGQGVLLEEPLAGGVVTVTDPKPGIKIWDDDFIDLNDGRDGDLEAMTAMQDRLHAARVGLSAEGAAEFSKVERLLSKVVALNERPSDSDVSLGVFPSRNMKIWVPPYTRVRLGSIEYVDGYWRVGDIMSLSSDERRAIASRYRAVGELGGDVPGHPIAGYVDAEVGAVYRDRATIESDLRAFLDPLRGYSPYLAEKITGQVTAVKEAQDRVAARQEGAHGVVSRIVDSLPSPPTLEQEFDRMAIAASASDGGLVGLPGEAVFPEGDARYVVVSSTDGHQIQTLDVQADAVDSAARMARVLREDVGVYAVVEGGAASLMLKVDPADVLVSEEE